MNSVSGATNGTVVLNANGTVTFTPTADYTGPASFAYKSRTPPEPQHQRRHRQPHRRRATSQPPAAADDGLHRHQEHPARP